MNKKYNNNYLIDVIFRIDFFPKENLFNESNSINETLDKYISEEFKVDRNIIENTFIKINSPAKNGLHTEQLRSNLIVYKSKDSNDLNIEIAKDNITIILKKYEDFTAFKKIIRAVTDKFNEIYPIENIERIGLRYINKFDFGVTEEIYNFQGYFKDSLIENINFIENRNEIKRAYQIYEINTKDDIGMTIRSGIFNTQYPNILNSKEFFLDMDAYKRNIDFKDLCNISEELNEIITTYFEKSIEEKTRDLLNK